MIARLCGLGFGMAFGFWLCWARFTSYDVIMSGLQFRDLYLWLMFGTAVTTAAIGLRLLSGFGARTWLGGDGVSWTRARVQRAHVVGSILFGLGWAVAGTCPGPAAAQIGHGQLAGLFTAGGILAGVWLQGRLAQRGKIASVPALTTPPGDCAQAAS